MFKKRNKKKKEQKQNPTKPLYKWCSEGVYICIPSYISINYRGKMRTKLIRLGKPLCFCLFLFYYSCIIFLEQELY